MYILNKKLYTFHLGRVASLLCAWFGGPNIKILFNLYAHKI